MATLTATPRSLPAQRGEALHHILVSLGAVAAAVLILLLAINGFSYYRLPLEQRPLSPLHPVLRSSGTVGLKLGMLSACMFCLLLLYPLRKRWPWLSRIGSTRRWLNFHVLLGITTPVIVTFHTAFKWHGLAGLAYWTMIAVALSGFVGRYVYAKIPRRLTAAKFTAGELEAEMTALAERLRENHLFTSEDLGPLLHVPTAEEARRMSLVRVLAAMLWGDLARPFRIGRLRRRAVHGPQLVTTLGGLLHSHDTRLESLVASVRRQSRLRTAVAFLDRSERVFHLWHVVHRPFSISFVVLILIHVGVAVSVGF